MTDSSPSNLVASLRELSQAFVDGRQDRYGMRVPAEPDRDGDLVCSRAAAEIERLQRVTAQLRDNIGELIGENAELAESLTALLATRPTLADLAKTVDVRSSQPRALASNPRLAWALVHLGNAVGSAWATRYEHDEWLSVIKDQVEQLQLQVFALTNANKSLADRADGQPLNRHTDHERASEPPSDDLAKVAKLVPDQWPGGDVWKIGGRLFVLFDDALDAIRRTSQQPALNLAPIAKVIVREDWPAQVEMYAPGLPVGEHDVFPAPVDAKGEWRPFLGSANSCADPEPCVSHMALESLQAQLRELSQAMSNPALEWDEDSSIEAALIAEATRRLAQPPKTRRDTGVTDEAGLPILEGDRVNVTWLAELGITELDCEAVGTVEYMPDRITAAWFVKFDSPFRRHVGPEGIYESDSMMLIQTTGDEFTCAFEKLPATPPANAGDAP